MTSFKVVNSSQRFSDVNTSYLTAYDSIINNLITTNVGATSLVYTPPPGSQIYSVVGYTPTDFATTDSKTAYFLNETPGSPAIPSYGAGVFTLPVNAYITSATLDIITSILPSQSPYRTITIGTQPITDTTPLIDGDIVSGDSSHFIAGESFTMNNVPLNNGQYIGGFLDWPSSSDIPAMAVTVGVDFIPSPEFVSGSFSLTISYIVI
jgi:hypothetical protein